jgi:DNA polymerase III epsilon subunit-like protein
MKHLWNHKIAAIDVETTGLIAGYHEIIQIGVVPLDNTLKPDAAPFYTNVRPCFPERMDIEAMSVNRLDYEALMDAPPQDRVIDLLTEWIERLNLPHGGRLIPLSHNWTFEKSFLTAWLGPKGLDGLFHGHARDSMAYALSVKDKYALRGKMTPFDSVSLPSLGEYFSIINENPHDALEDAKAGAAVYKALLEM